MGVSSVYNFSTCPGIPELLFEKIEDETIAAQVQKSQDTKIAIQTAAYKPIPVKDNVAFDDFMKMDIRVATVLDCQKVPKADKLLQFKLNDGMGNVQFFRELPLHTPFLKS